VESSDSRQEPGPPRFRLDLKSGTVLVGIYIALYLVVGGLLRVVTPADAGASAGKASTAPSTPAIASPAQTDVAKPKTLPRIDGSMYD